MDLSFYLKKISLTVWGVKCCPRGPGLKLFVPGVELGKVTASRRWDIVKGLWS